MKTGRILRAAGLIACALAAIPSPVAQDAPQRRGFAIQITAPKNDEIVLGKTKITASVRVEDPQAIERVEFLVSGKVVFVDREAPYECFYEFGEESRSWVIRAVAYHRDGITVSDSVVSRKVTFSFVEEVNRIVLWASVTDKNDQLVSDLGVGDFAVFEDGKEQKILDFASEKRPITLAILLDGSGSMRDKMKEVHAAAEAFVDTLRDSDQALVIVFDEKVLLIQDATSDKRALKEAITSTEAIGNTAVYDALHAAYRKLREIEGRKAVVLLTDGGDTVSHVGFERLVEEAKGESVIVYGIGLGSFGAVDRDLIRDIPDVTGGRSFFIKKASDLGGVYERIAEELRKLYYFTYSTPNPTWDGRFIHVEVKPHNDKLQVRARKGYFAVRPKQ